jgi:hemolysin D
MLNTSNPNPQDRTPQDRSKVAKRKISAEPNQRQIQQPINDTYRSEEFAQEVVFEQSRGWSRGIIWTIMGITTGLVAWASLMPLEEAVPATGKLEPVGKVKDVQVPVAGVVKDVAIKDGDKVNKGQKLLSLESTVSKGQLAALESNLASLSAESKFYNSLLAQGVSTVNPQDLAKLNVRPEILSLTKSRSSILSENQLYRAELNNTTVANLTPEQTQRLQSSRAELNSRMNSGKSEIAQAENQMRENRNRRSGINTLLTNAQATIVNIEAKAKAKESQLAAQMAENRTQQKNSQELLVSNQTILNSLKPAVEAGALSKNQALKQQEEVTTRGSEVTQLNDRHNKLLQDLQEVKATSRLEIQTQQQQIAQYKNEIAQLDQEYNRLMLVVNQSKEKLTNSFQTSRKDLLAKIAANDKQIAEIDGQLNKSIVEIDRKIAELNSQIAQAKQNLKYQDIYAPVSGKVFELKAGTPGFVANVSEPILKIVPDNKLTAKVYITNKDIGFVKVGMPVDVRIDTFPYSEYGDVKGKVVSIGSDALPVDQANPYERFPATIELAKQDLVIKGQPKTLQSGYAVSVNIKVRERTVMSLLTDMVIKQGEGLKTVR